MRILILRGNDRNGGRAGMGLGTLLFAGFLTVLLSTAIGLAAYRINVFLSKDMDSVLDDVRIAELREELRERHWDLLDRKDELAGARQEVQDHIDALGIKLGEIQAQMFRINALGQRLAEMSGIDKDEFDFSHTPGIGGIAEDGSTADSYEYPEFLARLDELQLMIQYDENRLAVMESLLMDEKISRTMFPDAWPVKGGWISSLFGYRSDPFTGKKAFHSGLDIAGRKGSAVQAAAAGVVVHAGRKRGYGNSVEIRHANGYSTRYAHADELLVAPGEKIEKGQPIATVGNTGRSTGPHLHFEVIKDDRRVNPKKFLQASR
jgi:murein DD-endopeptidase MepM/ murein hydrolase activator NlpD